MYGDENVGDLERWAQIGSLHGTPVSVIAAPIPSVIRNSPLLLPLAPAPAPAAQVYMNVPQEAPDTPPLVINNELRRAAAQLAQSVQEQQPYRGGTPIYVGSQQGENMSEVNSVPSTIQYGASVTPLMLPNATPIATPVLNVPANQSGWSTSQLYAADAARLAAIPTPVNQSAWSTAELYAADAARRAAIPTPGRNLQPVQITPLRTFSRGIVESCNNGKVSYQHTNPFTGTISTVHRDQAAKGSFPQEIANFSEDVSRTIAGVSPMLTDKQRRRLLKRYQNVHRVIKGPHAGDPKTPTINALEKVRLLAMEMRAKRARAYAQATYRSAQMQRHALQTHKKPVYLPDGSVINKNKRYEKKLAANAVKKAAMEDSKVEQWQIRSQLTTRNKAENVAVARAHERTVSKKDLRPAMVPLRVQARAGN